MDKKLRHFEVFSGDNYLYTHQAETLEEVIEDAHNHRNIKHLTIKELEMQPKLVVVYEEKY